LAIAVPAAYTVIFVHYDFVASVIASSSTSLLRQPQTASAPLFAALRFATVPEPPLLVSLTWIKVHTGLVLCMLDASNTAACLLPRVTRVNSTNILNEGLRIGEVGRQMNSKVKQSNKVRIKSKLDDELGLLSICPSLSSPGPYI
jgi:hypothetical protein